MIVLVIALVIMHRLISAVLISSTIADYHTLDNHYENISGIRTRTIILLSSQSKILRTQSNKSYIKQPKLKQCEHNINYWED